MRRCTLRKLFVALFAVIAAGARGQQFSQPTVIPTLNWPVAVYSADVNEDGHPDLIYIDYGATIAASTTHILLNNGDGTFRPGATLATAGSALAIGHFDASPTDADPAHTVRDAHVDIAWISIQGRFITSNFAYGKGDGTFAPTILGNITLGPANVPNIVSLVAAPAITGQADFLFAVDSANTLGIDTFYRLSSYQTFLGPHGAGQLQAADLKGDGVTDFLITPSGTAADTFLSAPLNRPAYAASYAGSGQVFSTLLADMDGDGRPDLITEGSNGRLDIYHGNTNGSFSTTSEIGVGAANGLTGNGGHLIAVADLNGDGIPDILTSTPAGISVLIGTGGLNYRLGGIYNAGPGRTSYVIADFDGDNHLDLAVDSPEGIVILFGVGDGSFRTSRSFAAGQPAYALALGRFTGTGTVGSGYVDAVVATGIPQFQLLTGDNLGGFSITTPASPANSPQTNATRTLWSSVVQGYIDSDTSLDLAVTKVGAAPITATGGITLHFGNNNGTFMAPVTADPSGTSHYGSSTLTELNNDGITDIVSLDQSACATYAIAARTGTTPGTILALNPTQSPYNLVTAGYIKSGSGNVNRADIVCELNGSPAVFQNNGAGVFRAPVILPAPPGVAVLDSSGTFPATGLFPSALLFTDLDGDTFGDVVAIYHNLAADPAHPSPSTANQIYIYWGNGDGTFTAPTILTTTRNDYEANIADVNGDSRPDLLLSDGYILTVLPGQGSARTFGPEQHYLAGQGINGILAYPVNAHNAIVVANGGRVFSNPAINRGTLAANAEVNTGGITVLLRAAATTPPTGLLPTTTLMTQVVSPIHYGEIIGDVAQGFAQPATPGNMALLDGGNLNFLIDGNIVCTLPFITGKTQVCPATTGAGYNVGTYQLSAMYTGNAIYAPSTSPNYPVQVIPDDTTGTLTASTNPAAGATPVTFTAAFTSVFATPTGTVTFFDGTTQIGTAKLDPTGTATLNTSTLAIGTHPITAALAASLNFNASSTAVLQQVIVPPPAATVTLLASNFNPSIFGQNVTFTAAVAAPGTIFANSTGTVTFNIDGAALSTVPLTHQSTASFAISTLAIGSHTVVATYSGTAAAPGTYFGASTSATLIQVVNVVPPAPSFTLTATPAAISVPIGNSVYIVVTITPQNGFNQPVTLSCGALPRGVLCVFNTDTIVNANGTALLRVTATAPHDCNSNAPYFIASGPTTWLGIFTTSGLILLARRRRKLAKSILLALSLSILPGLTGCGHCTDLGVFPGNYTFNVTGTSSSPISETATQTIHMVAHL